MGTQGSIIFGRVGQGSWTLISLGNDKHILVDVYQEEGTDEDPRFDGLDYLLEVLPEVDGKPFLDVLIVTHSHTDHISGFPDLLEEVTIGEIWYPDYNRYESEEDDPGEAYKAFHQEIERRKSLRPNEGEQDTRGSGDRELALTAGMTFNEIGGEGPVDGFEAKVLAPFLKDEEDPDNDIHAMNVVTRIEVAGVKLLFAGDSEREQWEDRIMPKFGDEAEEWINSDVLLTAHHGSYRFFGKTAEEAREEPFVEGLEAIDPQWIIVSSASKAPQRHVPDSDPPHAAAVRNYNKFLRGKRRARENEDLLLYTCDGNIKVDLKTKPEIDPAWEPADQEVARAAAMAGGAGEFSPRKHTSRHAPNRFA